VEDGEVSVQVRSVMQDDEEHVVFGEGSSSAGVEYFL